MSHQRQKIRDAVVTLITGLTLTETRVSSTPVYATDSLPSLRVFASVEEIDDSIGGVLGRVRTSYRVVTLVIEAHVQGTGSINDTLDDVCEDVEIAMSTDYTLSGTCEDSFYTGAEFEQTGESEQPIHIARMTYAAHYRVADNAPGTLVT